MSLMYTWEAPGSDQVVRKQVNDRTKNKTSKLLLPLIFLKTCDILWYSKTTNYQKQNKTNYQLKI